MKKTKIGFIIVGILLCLIVAIIILLLSGKEKDILAQNDEEIAVRECCWEMVEQYEIEETCENGEVVVSLSAPDYSLLAEIIYSKQGKIATENLLNEIQNKSVEMKTYYFTAETAKEEHIKTAFFDKVVYELMIEAITQTEYSEEWSVEE